MGRSYRFLILVLFLALYLGGLRPAPARIEARAADSGLARGVLGDWAADIILGQPDFAQITPNQVVANKLFNPGGVYVDRAATPDRVYIYDGGNSRVLGLSSLGVCVAGAQGGQACTANTDCPGSVCQVDPDRPADIVLGQPDFTSSACNGDSAFQDYPTPPAPNANTLCGLRWEQISITEGGSMATLASDAGGNLYVPDFFNNRVLRYNDPFTSDASADGVWGQPNFTGQACNRGNPAPDASSLCLAPPPGYGMLKTGVALDPAGNLWVADTQNNRVLRFPYNPATGAPAVSADLVLGQPGFSSAAAGTALNQMQFPASVRVDASQKVYVADGTPATGNAGRVLVFQPPFSNGMSASLALTSGMGEPTGLEIAPDGSLWVNDCDKGRLLNFASDALQKTISNVPSRLWGGLGVDSAGNLLATGWDPQQVLRYAAPGYAQDTTFFMADEWGSFNQRGASGFNGGPLGLEVTANQVIVADGARLLFWNAWWSLSNYQAADGLVGQSDFTTNPRWDPIYGRMRADRQGILWVVKGSSAFGTGMYPEIQAFRLPLTGGQSPYRTIQSPIPLLGGGSLSWDWSLILAGIDVQPECDCLWLADEQNHRVFRIRAATSNPTVDILLGQFSASQVQCNQGRGPSSPSRDSLCHPGGVALDQQGNLYVADHNLEFDGNLRLLEWDASLLPANPASALYAIPASRVFGRNNDFTEPDCQPGDPLCAPWEPAFNSQGLMALGFNGYLGPRFPQVYTDPLNNPLPSAALLDFHSMPFSARFDQYDNLYVLDHNRNRVLIYHHKTYSTQSTWLPIVAKK